LFIAPLKKIWNSDADENYAYCEFFEGSTIDGDEEHEAYYFKEYYDLDDDPYQLDNIYDQLGMEYEILTPNPGKLIPKVFRNFSFPRRDTDRFLENSSKKEDFLDRKYLTTFCS